MAQTTTIVQTVSVDFEVVIDASEGDAAVTWVTWDQIGEAAVRIVMDRLAGADLHVATSEVYARRGPGGRRWYPAGQTAATDADQPIRVSITEAVAR